MNKTFDIYKFLKKRPLSWSSLSCFEYNPEEWYQRYPLGVKSAENAEMKFGKIFADSCEAGNPLRPVTVLSAVEHPFKVVFGKIHMVGFADTFDKDTKRRIGEYKTGVKPWTQKRVNEHGQIDMYLLMNFITNRVKPEEVKAFLEWIPTMRIDQENGDFSKGDYRVEFRAEDEVFHFDTKRTMSDILHFGARINKAVLEMQEYVRNHE